jgi:hypothetical protein
MMDTLPRCLIAVSIAAMLIGCSTNVPLEKVYGMYKASYPFGTETITLNRGGSLVQVIAMKDQPPVTVYGKWKFDSQGSRVNLEDIKIVVDGTGQLSSDWQTAMPGTASLDVEMHWFRIIMASAATYPYVKQ